MHLSHWLGRTRCNGLHCVLISFVPPSWLDGIVESDHLLLLCPCDTVRTLLSTYWFKRSKRSELVLLFKMKVTQYLVYSYGTRRDIYLFQEWSALIFGRKKNCEVELRRCGFFIDLGGWTGFAETHLRNAPSQVIASCSACRGRSTAFA